MLSPKSLDLDEAMLLAYGVEQALESWRPGPLLGSSVISRKLYSLRPNFLSCEMRLILYRADVDVK